MTQKETRIRPDWDTYFMSIAGVAATRFLRLAQGQN